MFFSVIWGHFDYKPCNVSVLPCDLFSEWILVWLIIVLIGHQSLVSGVQIYFYLFRSFRLFRAWAVSASWESQSRESEMTDTFYSITGMVHSIILSSFTNPHIPNPYDFPSYTDIHSAVFHSVNVYHFFINLLAISIIFIFSLKYGSKCWLKCFLYHNFNQTIKSWFKKNNQIMLFFFLFFYQLSLNQCN